MLNFTIKRATRQAEMVEVISACDAAFDFPVMKRQYCAKLITKLHDSAFFLYACTDQILGYIAFYANDTISRNAYISLIAVAPKYQKMHIGSCLLKKCMETATECGMTTLLLEVKKYNDNAIRFYHSHGFTQYAEKSAESYLFQKSLL